MDMVRPPFPVSKTTAKHTHTHTHTHMKADFFEILLTGAFNRDEADHKIIGII